MFLRILILLLLPLRTPAQLFNAAPFLGMGNTGLAQGSLYSISNNPAGIALLENIQAGVAYQSHFLSSEIQSQALYLAVPFSSSNAVAFGVNSYGLKEVSNLLTLRGVYSKRFGHLFSSAISINSHRYYVKNYEDDQALSLDLGFQYYVNDYVTIGALARNVTSARYQDHILQYIPVEFGLGFCYIMSKELRIACDAYYDKYIPLSYRGGIAFNVDSRVSVRGGVGSHPIQYFGGVGLVVAKLHIDIASSFHSRLGTSPQLAIAYVF